MPIQSKYVLIASMDVDPAFEDLFNEVYDGEHVPHLLKVPGVRSVARLKGEPFTLAIAGGFKEMPAPAPIYTAIYEIDDPDVLKGSEWARAVEAGRWASEVRPHTRSRHHAVYATQSTNPRSM
jgi:hypothetical protein